MANSKDIKRFQKLYAKQFGVTLTVSEASEKLTQLLTLVRHVYKPIRRDHHEPS